jgi:hypothetical protein
MLQLMSKTYQALHRYGVGAPPCDIVPRIISSMGLSLTENVVRVHCSSTQLICVYYYTSLSPYYPLLLH